MDFELRPPSNLELLKPSKASKPNSQIIEMPIENLIAYKNHPFSLYTGERYENLLASIKENGVLTPLIVRPIENSENQCEILAGHNRKEAAKEAGLETVPCLPRYNLTEEEAYTIVMETNLQQRSFDDFSHSEKAGIITYDYEQRKKQGKRNDLMKDIDLILSQYSGEADSLESKEKVQGVKSNKITGDKYGLSKDSIARYLRINKLDDELKALIDKSELSIRAGVWLSYTTAEQQESIFHYASENNIKLEEKRLSCFVSCLNQALLPFLKWRKYF